MTLGHKWVRTLHRCVAGSAAVEFAIIAMVVILVCVGMIEVGRGLYVYNEIAYAADVGARKILLKNTITDANLKTAIRDAFRFGDPNLLVINSGVGSDFRTIDISYPFNLLIPARGGHQIRLRLSRQIPLAHPLT